MTNGVTANPGAARQTGTSTESISGDYWKVQAPLIVRPRTVMHRQVFPAAPTEEVATLVVNGMIYQDWETVWVQWDLQQPWAQFKFTATEDYPPTIQFGPGDKCQVYLGGYPVISGTVLIRQVAYDKNNKGITIQGVSTSWYTARASVVDATQEYKGDFLTIAAKVLAPTCSGWHPMGNISGLPFPTPVQANSGETIFQFLETLGRMRNVFVVSDPYGDFVFIGDHVGQVIASLTEGENILKMQCLIEDLQPYSEYIIRGQSPANDEHNMGAAAHMEAYRTGTAKCYSPDLVAAEFPAWTVPELQLRANHEYDWKQRIVEAHITVQGWFNPITGQRWDPAQTVWVYSPMAMLNMTMVIEAVTFTQDSSSGSLTELKCVAPWNWNDNNWQIGPGNHPLIQPPPTQGAIAIPEDKPAQSPPVQLPDSVEPKPWQSSAQAVSEAAGAGGISFPE
jgi:prophage tail gpP-like protein